MEEKLRVGRGVEERVIVCSLNLSVTIYENWFDIMANLTLRDEWSLSQGMHACTQGPFYRRTSGQRRRVLQ